MLFVTIGIGIWRLFEHRWILPAFGILLVTLFIISTYLNLFVYRSLHSPDIWSYFILIPLAGLLLGRRQMSLFALLALSVVALSVVALLFYGQTTQDVVAQATLPSPAIDILLLGSAVVLSTFLSQAMIYRAEAKAMQAEAAMQALVENHWEVAQSRQALAQAHRELEVRVAERTAALQSAQQRLQAEAEERQRLMEALGHSEAHWSSLVANAPEMIVTVTVDGMIQFSNRTINGRAPAQLIGQSFTVLHSMEAHQQRFAHAIRAVLATGQSVSYESQVLVDNLQTWQLNHLGPIFEAGEITALMLIATDLTQQKQAELAIIQAQKLESLGIMAGGVAHDFNNLLTIIIGRTSMALERLTTEHLTTEHLTTEHLTTEHLTIEHLTIEQRDLRELLQPVLFAGERATDLTRQMLNYVGHTPTDFVPLDLSLLVQENLDFYAATVAKTIAVQGDLTDELPAVMADTGQLQQVIMNLILNAADAIGETSGEITVRTTLHELTQADLHSNAPHGGQRGSGQRGSGQRGSGQRGGGQRGGGQWAAGPPQPGTYVGLEVTDSGCGMAKETLNKIFGPFFTTKFTGRGLGLAGVSGIVRAHKGAIYVSSIPGIGTTFQLFFPAATVAAPPAPCIHASDPPTDLAGTLILLIEDDESIRDATANLLASLEIRTLEAADGAAGLQLFRTQMAEIDLVLLDHSMPGMSGTEVMQQLWAMKPDLPIVLLSGYDKQNVTQRLDTLHPFGFLQKPYRFDDLCQVILQQLSCPSIDSV